MASNPVFNRIDKESSGYAGFGAPQGQGSAAPTMQPGAQRQGGASAQELEDVYNAPPAGAAQVGRLTLDDVVMKSLLLFGLVLVTAGATWMVVGDQPGIAMPVWLLGMFGSLGLSFAIGFSKKVNVPLIVVHAVLQGLFIGAVSVTFESLYPGVVTSAVTATMATFAGMFLGWKVGIIKVTSKSRRIFGLMAMGYMVFLFANLAAGWFFGAGGGMGVYGMGPLAIVISIFGVGMASYSIAMDFDSIDRGIAAGAPQKYSWLMGHGIIASLVWLYIEFLRLFMILNQD